MSFVLRDQWAVRCDRCGHETGREYASLALADLCVLGWGWESDAGELEDVTLATRHVCPDCAEALKRRPC